MKGAAVDSLQAPPDLDRTLSNSAPFVCVSIVGHSHDPDHGTVTPCDRKVGDVKGPAMRGQGTKGGGLSPPGPRQSSRRAVVPLNPPNLHSR